MNTRSEVFCCLLLNGHSITHEVATFLLETAHDLMHENGRKKRVRLEKIGLRGEVTTSYKMTSFGQVTGFVFRGNIDWNSGAAKVHYIVEPINRSFVKELMRDGVWVAANPNFIPESRKNWQN
jgi:hypothetical protein